MENIHRGKCFYLEKRSPGHEHQARRVNSYAHTVACPAGIWRWLGRLALATMLTMLSECHGYSFEAKETCPISVWNGALMASDRKPVECKIQFCQSQIYISISYGRSFPTGGHSIREGYVSISTPWQLCAKTEPLTLTLLVPDGRLLVMAEWQRPAGRADRLNYLAQVDIRFKFLFCHLCSVKLYKVG